jgi:hypothetical protein
MPTHIPVSDILKLKQWLSNPLSSLLLAQGQGVRTSSADFAADFINAVLEKGYPILWALPSPVEGGDSSPSVIGILRSLIIQALTLAPNIVSDGMNPIRTQHLRNIVAVDQWFRVLERCLTKIPRLFLVVNMALVEEAVNSDELQGMTFKASDFIQNVSEMVHNRTRGGLKVVIISWQFETVTSLETNEVFGDVQIVTDLGRRMERLMRLPKYRAVLKRRNEAFVNKFKSAMEVLDSYVAGSTSRSN